MKNKSAIGVGTQYKIDNRKKGHLTDHTNNCNKNSCLYMDAVGVLLGRRLLFIKSNFIQ